MIAETLTTRMNTVTAPAPVVTTVGSDITPTIISRSDTSMEWANCTLSSVTTSFVSCTPLQLSRHPDSTFAVEVASTLPDGDLVTCTRPFQNNSQLRLAIHTRCFSSIRIQVTGEGLDCMQPSTLVYVDLPTQQGAGTPTDNIDIQECPLRGNSHSQTLVTCTYECRPLVPCDSSMSFGVQVQRLSWLARSQHLEQLCDIRAFIWIWIHDALKYWVHQKAMQIGPRPGSARDWKRVW